MGEKIDVLQMGKVFLNIFPCALNKVLIGQGSHAIRTLHHTSYQSDTTVNTVSIFMFQSILRMKWKFSHLLSQLKFHTASEELKKVENKSKKC